MEDKNKYNTYTPYMIQGSSEPLRHLSYSEEQLEHAIRRAEDEGKEVSVLQEQEDMGSPCLARDKEILHGMRVVSLVRAGRDNEKGGGTEMESAAEVHIEALVEDELESIIEEHGLFADDHHAWAVIKEELEEANEDVTLAGLAHASWWKRIREDDTDNLDVVDEIEKYAIEAIKELVQVIACCRKYKWKHLKEWVQKRVERVGGEHDAD